MRFTAIIALAMSAAAIRLNNARASRHLTVDDCPEADEQDTREIISARDDHMREEDAVESQEHHNHTSNHTLGWKEGAIDALHIESGIAINLAEHISEMPDMDEREMRHRLTEYVDPTNSTTEEG